MARVQPPWPLRIISVSGAVGFVNTGRLNIPNLEWTSAEARERSGVKSYGFSGSEVLRRVLQMLGRLLASVPAPSS
jgi:hypothetical protein